MSRPSQWLTAALLPVGPAAVTTLRLLLPPNPTAAAAAVRKTAGVR